MGQGGPDAANEALLAKERETMVQEQIRKRGIRDPRLLDAMVAVHRHRFVSPELASRAYEDRPLPIGFGQTISQPYMVARAMELVAPEPENRALEIGAGCGYQTAVLARLCRAVFGVEIVPELARRARATLAEMGCVNAVVEAFDGSGGWPDEAPFDVIVVSAGALRVPPLLVDQLAEGGRLVIPLGPPDDQTLVLVERVDSGRYQIKRDIRCRYVDLMGRYGLESTPVSA